MKAPMANNLERRETHIHIQCTPRNEDTYRTPTRSENEGHDGRNPFERAVACLVSRYISDGPYQTR